MSVNTSLVFDREKVDIGVRVVTYDEPGAPSFYYAAKGRKHFLPVDPMFEGISGPRKDQVSQAVIHHDGTRDSWGCFRVLVQRELSTHLMINWDGTVYQPLNLRDIAYHAAQVNREAIGIDLNNPVRPERNREEAPRELFVGKINGGTVRSLGYTDPQYDSLIAVLTGLNKLFPKLRLLAPIGADGRVVRQKLVNIQFHGIVGHLHVSATKWDPGPGFDWERMLIGVRGSRLYFPITLPGTRNLAQVPKKQALKEAEDYYANTEQGVGGYYPVGVNQAWHSGVHLDVAKNTPVLAPADGTVVVARQVEPDRMGSPNVLVIKHTLDVDAEKKTFFSVLSHLALETLTPNSGIPWIRRLFVQQDGPTRLPDDDAEHPPSAKGRVALTAGRVALIKVDVKAGELVGHTGTFSGATHGADMLELLDFAILAKDPIFDLNDATWEVADGDAAPDILCNSRAVWKRIIRKPKELRALVDGAWPLAPSEVRMFYASDKAARDMRWTVARHAVEFSDQTDFAPLFGGGVDFEWNARRAAKDYINRVRPYLWWDEGVTAHTGLPEDRLVYTYHPITLLAVIAMGEARKVLQPGDDGAQVGLEGAELARAAREDAAYENEHDFRTACSLGRNEDLVGGTTLDEAADVDPEGEGWMRWEQGEWEPE